MGYVSPTRLLPIRTGGIIGGIARGVKARAATPSSRYSGERAGERGERRGGPGTDRFEGCADLPIERFAPVERGPPHSPALSPAYGREGGRTRCVGAGRWRRLASKHPRCAAAP